MSAEERTGRNKVFDCLLFKEEMQRRAEARLAGVPPQDRVRRMQEEIEASPLGEWWKRTKRTSPAS